jgi:hypothetical protein
MSAAVEDRLTDLSAPMSAMLCEIFVADFFCLRTERTEVPEWPHPHMKSCAMANRISGLQPPHRYADYEWRQDCKDL